MNSASEASGSGLKIVVGTIEEARRMIGTCSEPITAEFAVNEAMIQYYCSVVEDGNASYWDATFAGEQWGGIIAPPGMLQSWTIPLAWRPEGAHPLSALALQVPLPGDSPVNLSSEVEFFQPVRVGDLITHTDRLAAISDEKTNRLGTGYFVTTVGEYRNQRQELLARSTNVLFRYKPHPAPP